MKRRDLSRIDFKLDREMSAVTPPEEGEVVTLNKYRLSRIQAHLIRLLCSFWHFAPPFH